MADTLGFKAAVLAALLAVAPGRAAAAQIPLTLAEAVGIALRDNPALAAAAGRETGARAAYDQAVADRWPQLRVESRLAHVSEVPTYEIAGRTVTLAENDTWVTAATLQQLVYSGGRVVALARQSGLAAEAARGARRRTRQVVAFGAERAFRSLLAVQEEAGVAALNLAAANSHLRVAGERFAARAAARFDVLRAEVQLEEARQDVIRADGNLLVAQALLLQALGLPGGEYRALPAAAAAAAIRPGIDELLAAAVRQRPDLEGLSRQRAAAEAGVSAARAERRPTLALAADYQYATPESPTVFSRWSVGALVSLPILDGGRALSRRHAAEAALVQARAALDQGRRQVEAEVRQAVARVDAAAAQMSVAQRQVELAEELSRLAGVRFAGGVGTATEVADAQGSLARARYGLARAEADRGIAEAEQALAVGSVTAEEPPERAQPTPREGAKR